MDQACLLPNPRLGLVGSQEIAKWIAFRQANAAYYLPQLAKNFK